MSLWWKTNLRRSSQRFEPPYVHSTSLFSFNPILHFSSSLSGVYIDPAFFSPNVAGSSATVASPSARHIPKKSVRPRRLISATQLRYRAMMTKTATLSKRKIRKISRNLSELLCHQSNAPLAASSVSTCERAASLRVDNAGLCLSPDSYIPYFRPRRQNRKLEEHRVALSRSGSLT